MFFLLDADGRVFASPPGSKRGRRALPFGLKRTVNRIIARSRDIFAAGEADFSVVLPLVVRIFSIQRASNPTIGLYIEPATRNTDPTP